MAARSLHFIGPHEVEVQTEAVPEPRPGEVLVRTTTSAISAGTELLVYRGEVPPDLPVDETIEGMTESFSYPLRYGYACVGQVSAVSDDVDDDWLDRRVFAFHPHASHFTARPQDLVPVPQGCPPGQAALLANVETAVNFLLDGSPRLGERVAVFGQGVVGLLTTALLSRCPLDAVVSVDLHERRRTLSEAFGADASLAPTEDIRGAVQGRNDNDRPGGADLSYELSGDPATLDDAIAATGYGGRVVIGSWYGTREAPLELGGRFHRDRIQLASSQVSTIAPALRGRWTTKRRIATAWRWLETLDVDRLVTHRKPVEAAAEAYRLLDERPDEAIQVLLTYGGE